MGESDEPRPDGPVEIDDVLSKLEELEATVDDETERRQVRETMRTARRARRPRILGRFRDQFGLRDAGEAVVGSFVFGVPMIVEDGTFTVGEYIAGRPLALVATALVGVTLTFGVLYAGGFEDAVDGGTPGLLVRPVGIFAVAAAVATGLLTAWGRVSWAEPTVAVGQTLVVWVVMGVGASLGDVLPER